MRVSTMLNMRCDSNGRTGGEHVPAQRKAKEHKDNSDDGQGRLRCCRPTFNFIIGDWRKRGCDLHHSVEAVEKFCKRPGNLQLMLEGIRGREV
jgi:hypothetical protein